MLVEKNAGRGSHGTPISFDRDVHIPATPRGSFLFQLLSWTVLTVQKMSRYWSWVSWPLMSTPTTDTLSSHLRSWQVEWAVSTFDRQPHVQRASRAQEFPWPRCGTPSDWLQVARLLIGRETVSARDIQTVAKKGLQCAKSLLAPDNTIVPEVLFQRV